MKLPLDIRTISRRDFLKINSTLLLALLIQRPSLLALAQLNDTDESMPGWGRITQDNEPMYDQPSPQGKEVCKLWADLVLPITGVLIGTEPTYNRTWYEINKQGFVHSGHVQPVEISLNTPVTGIPESGVLAEVTVPFTDAVWDPNSVKKTAYRLYYSSIHWIHGVVTDEQGETWYKIHEDFYSYKFHVNASHLRIISPEEVTPLSTDIPADEKVIKVFLRAQKMEAYEGNTLVQESLCSSGVKYGYHYWTPAGKYTIDYKRPSRHMARHARSSPFHYDLPGVPWVSTFNSVGMAFHGTYWHNNFGHPASDGCINLPSPMAKWVYRWTTPVIPYDEDFLFKPGGTKVDIILEY